MKKVKILLINPDPAPDLSLEESGTGVPMAVVAIGSYLKKHHFEPVIIDGRLYKGNDIFSKIDENAKDVRVIGLSVMTAQIGEALRISKYIKMMYKDKVIVWGGVHPTLFPRQTLEDGSVDCVVVGEGEATFLELVEKIEGGVSISCLADVKGAGFKCGNETIINERRELISMDEIPPQAFELVDLERYIKVSYPFIGTMREVLVQSSRGCPHRCAFCINYAEKSYNHWRRKSPSLVIDEIRRLKDRYNLTAIGFRDENFFVNKTHAREVMEGLDGLSLRWFANVRADYFNEKHVSDGLLGMVRDTGGAYLGIGAESGSNRILDMITKDVTVEEVIFSAEQLQKYDLAASYSFIIGLPEETKEDILKTVALMKKLKKICPRSVFVGPQILRPYPGGSLYDLCVEHGYSSPQSLQEWASIERGKFGELSIANYPWIKHPSFVTAVSTYVPAALNYDFMKEIDFKRRVYAFLARVRVRFNFWSAPFEYRVGMRLLKYKNITYRFFSKLFSRKGGR